MALRNTRLLNTMVVKLMMTMLSVLKIGMAPTIKLSLDFATVPLMLFRWNLRDTTLSNKLTVLYNLDLTVQESIILWLPVLTSARTWQTLEPSLW